MNRFTMSNLALRMSYKVSPAEIDKIIGRLDIEPADTLYTASAEAVNVAALQIMLKQYTTLAEYVIDMNLYVADAVNRRAQLVCFPAYAGLLPASLAPQFANVLDKLKVPDGAKIPESSVIYETLSYFSDFIFEAYFHTMAALAARHNVYIMAGSSLYFEEEDLVHRAFLFSNTGELAGYQDKISLNDIESQLGIVPASEIRLFETPLGRLCILIGSDADYFETARIAKGLGAQMLLCPTAYSGEYNSITAALGLNMRVQEQKVYGVQSTLVGDTGFGMTLEGGTAVFAPNEMVKHKNGVISKCGGRYEPDIVGAHLNLDRLTTIKNPYTQDINRDFMHKYVDRLY